VVVQQLLQYSAALRSIGGLEVISCVLVEGHADIVLVWHCVVWSEVDCTVTAPCGYKWKWKTWFRYGMDERKVVGESV